MFTLSTHVCSPHVQQTPTRVKTCAQVDRCSPSARTSASPHVQQTPTRVKTCAQVDRCSPSARTSVHHMFSRPQRELRRAFKLIDVHPQHARPCTSSPHVQQTPTRVKTCAHVDRCSPSACTSVQHMFSLNFQNVQHAENAKLQGFNTFNTRKTRKTQGFVQGRKQNARADTRPPPTTTTTTTTTRVLEQTWQTHGGFPRGGRPNLQYQFTTRQTLTTSVLDVHMCRVIVVRANHHSNWYDALYTTLYSTVTCVGNSFGHTSPYRFF